MIYSFESWSLFLFYYFGGLHTGDKHIKDGFNNNEHAFIKCHQIAKSLILSVFKIKFNESCKSL